MDPYVLLSLFYVSVLSNIFPVVVDAFSIRNNFEMDRLSMMKRIESVLDLSMTLKNNRIIRGWGSSLRRQNHAFVVVCAATVGSSQDSSEFFLGDTGYNFELEDDNDFLENDDFVDAQLPSREERIFSRNEIESLTVSQLKQQLRLRGLKVSGRKSELVERFLRRQQQQQPTDDAVSASNEREQFVSKARKFSDQQGKQLVDVTEYLDDQDLGQETKTWKPIFPSGDDSELQEDQDTKIANNNPEVWGAEARMVDDYEDGRIIVDCLSRSVVEFQGSNDTFVQAYVVASRDALKPFLAGGKNPILHNTENSNNNGKLNQDSNSIGRPSGTSTEAEERLRQIQMKREQESRRPIRWEDQAGLEEGDETGIYKDALFRDFSDWGVFTTTGAQLSAAEVQGVLLLSDVYGPFTEDNKALAEKIAFECQPVVVMAPDLFRGDSWIGPTTGTMKKHEGQQHRERTYDQWRGEHPDLRVNIDIRAAAACLRERYGVSSVVVWGMCYGGGRALEVASGWIPDRNLHDVNGKLGPPPVDPMACIAWYPTRYNLHNLFGKNHMGTVRAIDGKDRILAVMAIFAGKDSIPGARTSDAEALKKALEEDKRVKDHLVKIFPDQDHGFAHKGLGMDGRDSDDFERFMDEEFGGAGRMSFAEGDAEVACLLSTAFMETYSRVFLPTVGPPISMDPSEASWNRELEMKGESSKTDSKRNVRKEIEDSLNSFVEEPLGGYRIDPTDPSNEEELMRLLRSMESPSQKTGPFALEDDDNLSTIYAKLKAADENFQLF